jgi:hypothetical protein
MLTDQSSRKFSESSVRQTVPTILHAVASLAGEHMLKDLAALFARLLACGCHGLASQALAVRSSE